MARTRTALRSGDDGLTNARKGGGEGHRGGVFALRVAVFFPALLAGAIGSQDGVHRR